jgi:hypothetical protein
VWLDLDDSVIQTSGYAMQAAGRGYTGVKGLNALVATASTPLAAPVIAATRLRRGNARSFGERPPWSEALQVARRCGACGPVILRTDSAFYTRAVVTAAHEAGARFSVTTPLYPSVTRAVAAIADTPIRSPLSPMRRRSAIRRGRKRFLRQPRAPTETSCAYP